MATNKNPKEVVLVNFHEIPESICVETRFITQAAVKQKKTEQLFFISNKNGSFDLNKQDHQVVSGNNFQQVSKPTAVTLGIQAKLAAAPGATVQQCQPLQQARTAATKVPFATTSTNLNSNSNFFSNSSHGNSLNYANTMPLTQIGASQLNTLNSNSSALHATPLGTTSTSNIKNMRCIFTDQTQQTHFSAFNIKSVGTQCRLGDELEDLDVEWPSISEESSENLENTETKMQNFLKFINDNSTQQKNCKECLICGELCKSNKYFYGHMTIHLGPRVLCSKCGQNLDHENLLFQHKCRKAQQLENSILQCPNYTCSVKAISLMELYDHINEHDNNRMYKCSACCKGFCTGQEFLRHLLIRAKCYTSAKRKRFRVYGLESQKDRKCRVRVFTLHTFKRRTTLVKTFLSQRVDKKGMCKICLTVFATKSIYNRHRVMCVAKFRKRLIRKRGK